MALTGEHITAVAVPPAPPVRRRALLGSRRRQIAAALVVGAAIAFLLVEGLGNATEYYKTVPQALSARASLGTKQFRIMGYVDQGIRQSAGRTDFSISWAGQAVPVVDSEDPPQLFKAGVPVVLEGHFAPTGTTFLSDLIMVKHTADYAPPPGEPKSVVQQSAGS